MRLFNKSFFIGFVAGIVLLVGLLVLGASVFMATRPGDPAGGMAAVLSPPTFPSPTSRTLYGQVDEAWTVRRLDGSVMSLAECKDRVVFIHFWATWCRPWCIAELPGIQRLYDSMKNENIVFLIVSWDEEANVLRQFLDKNQYRFPVYWRAQEVPPALQSAGVPATFVVGRDGAIVFKHLGPAKWDDESTRVFLRTLL